MGTVLDELSVLDLVVEQTLSQTYERMRLSDENAKLFLALYPTREDFDKANKEKVEEKCRGLITDFVEINGEEQLKQNANVKKVL